MTKTQKQLFDALAKVHGTENVLSGKGGFWIKGQGHITTAQARKVTGINAEPRQFRGRVSAYGDYAIIAKLNRVKL